MFTYNCINNSIACTEDADCSGATDNCNVATGACKCGPNDACSGITPRCDGGDCKGMYM